MTREELKATFKQWKDAGEYTFIRAEELVFREFGLGPGDPRQSEYQEFIREIYAELNTTPKPAPVPIAEEEDEDDAEDAKPAERVPKVGSAEDLDLLPIPSMPGYSVDAYGIPHARKSRGRKGGPIKPDRFWRRREGRSPSFICGFRVRVGGIQKRYRPDYFQMARKIAEQKRAGVLDAK